MIFTAACGACAATHGKRLQVHTEGMEFATEMIVNAGQAGLRIGEVPTTLQKDGRDRPPHLRSFRDGWRHLRFILTHGPNYLFFAPGVALALPGLILVGLLANGPVRVSGHYLGIHFLALGSLLTLLGLNVLNLGVFANVLLPRAPSRVSSFVRRFFTLERGLIAGLIPAVAGLVVDVNLMLRWLGHPGIDMSDSVHLAFTASLAIVLGANVIFSSFLLWLLFSEHAPAVPTGNPARPPPVGLAPGKCAAMKSRSSVAERPAK